MIMRTLSKTMGAAGVRLGYLLGSTELVQQLTKLRLPYLLNHFAMEAAIFLLGSDDMKSFVRKNIDNVVRERTRVHAALEQMASGKGLWAKQSNANFLLLKFESQTYCNRVYQKLIEHGILVRDISAGPGLAGCLRMSIGQPHENDAFLEAIRLSLD
jgi:histidinol-phosphate aminotransferase